MNLLKQIKSELVKSKLTEQQIADGANVAKRSINYLKYTDRDPRFSTLDRLEKFFAKERRKAKKVKA